MKIAAKYMILSGLFVCAITGCHSSSTKRDLDRFCAVATEIAAKNLPEHMRAQAFYDQLKMETFGPAMQSMVQSLPVMGSGRPDIVDQALSEIAQAPYQCPAAKILLKEGPIDDRSSK